MLKSAWGFRDVDQTKPESKLIRSVWIEELYFLGIKSNQTIQMPSCSVLPNHRHAQPGHTYSNFFCFHIQHVIHISPKKKTCYTHAYINPSQIKT